jgi:hypothetical protein
LWGTGEREPNLKTTSKKTMDWVNAGGDFSKLCELAKFAIFSYRLGRRYMFENEVELARLASTFKWYTNYRSSCENAADRRLLFFPDSRFIGDTLTLNEKNSQSVAISWIERVGLWFMFLQHVHCYFQGLTGYPDAKIAVRQ